jgi:ribosomal protein S21
MGRSKPVNVSVKLDGKVKSFEQLIRRFMRKCKEEQIVEEYKKRTSYHLTRSQKKRNQKAAGKRRWKRKQQST